LGEEPVFGHLQSIVQVFGAGFNPKMKFFDARVVTKSSLALLRHQLRNISFAGLAREGQK
jgi:hypothetical protein